MVNNLAKPQKIVLSYQLTIKSFHNFLQFLNVSVFHIIFTSSFWHPCCHIFTVAFGIVFAVQTEFRYWNLYFLEKVEYLPHYNIHLFVFIACLILISAIIQSFLSLSPPNTSLITSSLSVLLFLRMQRNQPSILIGGRHDVVQSAVYHAPASPLLEEKGETSCWHLYPDNQVKPPAEEAVSSCCQRVPNLSLLLVFNRAAAALQQSRTGSALFGLCLRATTPLPNNGDCVQLRLGSSI